MKKSIVLITILLICICFVLCGCSSLSSKTYTSFDYFSTVVTFNALSDASSNSAQAWEDMQVSLAAMEEKLSSYVDGSDVDKFNKAAPSTTIEISKMTYEVLSMAKDIYQNTNGAYNPAMFLLSDLWGFTDRFLTSYTPTKLYDRQNPQEELPNETYINGFLSLSDYSQVTLSEDEGKYYVFKPALTWSDGTDTYTMQLDLGGIVKGYASAYLKDSAINSKVSYGYVSLGSSSIVMLGRSEKGADWDLKLKDPKDANNYYLSIPTKNAFVSTSGNYEQYYEIAGKRYCHIINPFTGYPIDNTTLSTSCIMPFSDDYIKQATYSDALSTALMVMDLNSAIKYLKDNAILGSIAVNVNGNYKVFTNIQNAKILGNYGAYEG